MADEYGRNVLPTRAIYPSARLAKYIILLVAFKCLRSAGLFLTYNILKLVHVVQFLFIVKLGASVILVFLQKPFTSGKKLSRNQWFRISRHAFFGSVINLLWLFGLTLCGPLRTILLYEHSDMVILAGASALFTNSGGGTSKMRGAVFFLLSVCGVLLFDHDEVHKGGENHPEGHHNSIITHLFYHVVSWTGMSDHMGGVALLFGTLCLNVGYNSASKKLSLDIGGGKRLHALSTLVSTLLLFPWAGFIFFTKDAPMEFASSLILPFLLVIVLVFVADFYIESICINNLEAVKTARIGSATMFISALVLSCFWWNPFATDLNEKTPAVEEHVLSGGVIFSFVLFLFAIHILTSPNRGSRASFIGYSAGGKPLYSFAGDALQRTSHSLFTHAKNGLTKILEDSDSRNIFYFLCINLCFTFVELIYGAWTNSLGLISDGFHMLFDCSALVMGLYAAVMSRWKATRIFSYGYDRFEVLSGYINGLFLVVISFFVFTEAIGRLFDPPEINTERLLTVAVAGLVVNLIGIFAFSHAHSHGGGSSHGHSHSQPNKGQGHGHSHGGHGHGHSHGHGHTAQEPVRHKNTNMEGVFLHVLADTLGSVGVIISTTLIYYFGLNIADPICSLFIATMIFLSVIPLLKETALILVLRTPGDMQKEIGSGLQKVLSIEGVVSFREQHFWEHSSKVTCGTLHVLTKPDISEQHIVAQVTAIFKEIGVNNLTVQVEKDAYFAHLSGLGASADKSLDGFSQNLQYLNNEVSFAIKAI